MVFVAMLKMSVTGISLHCCKSHKYQMHVNDQREVTEDLELGNESGAKADHEANVEYLCKIVGS
jgi:hypothetical protein